MSGSERSEREIHTYSRLRGRRLGTASPPIEVCGPDSLHDEMQVIEVQQPGKGGEEGLEDTRRSGEMVVVTG